MKIKKCTRCGKSLDMCDFSKSRYSKDGLNDECRICRWETKKQGNLRELELKRKAWQKETYGSVAMARRLERYGLTKEQFNAMYEGQNYRCAICGLILVPSGKGYNSVYIDHSHETGEIRGILCCKCNSGIGNFDEDKSIMQKAISYIEKFL